MGKKDAYQFDYLDDNERFADQVNGALFHGRQVVKPEELEPSDDRIIHISKEMGKRNIIEAVADKTRTWRGKQIHIITLQNQTYTDYRMVLRNMLSESIGYHKQWKLKKNAHERARDLREGSDAFLSGMANDEKFIPIITLVVYCGKEHRWNGARCLYELLDIDDEIKEYVTNYKLNLYDCHEHDTFDEYRTGLRQLFETIRYSNDKEQLHRIIEENKEAYSSIDSDTKELLEIMADVRIKEEYKVMEHGNERYNMCKAFEDMREDGRLEGRIESILELLEELGQVPQQIVELIKAEDNMSVLSRWHKSAARVSSIVEFEAKM